MTKTLDQEFKKLYVKLGFIDNTGMCCSLPEVCNNSKKCWGTEKDRLPVSNSAQAHISRPYIGKEYDKLRLLVVGINMNEHGGYYAFDGLIDGEYGARKDILNWIRRSKFGNPTERYVGTYQYYCSSNYGAAIASINNLINLKHSSDGLPLSQNTADAWDYISYTNHIKCSPTFENSRPSSEMWHLCGSHVLLEEIKILKPKYILILGITDNFWHFKDKVININLQSEYEIDDARYQKLVFDNEAIHLFAITHPSRYRKQSYLNFETLVNTVLGNK